MFLTRFKLFMQIIARVLQFIEDHPVLIGTITSMTVGSLWLRRLLQQKRAEAFLGFYAKLSLQLRNLKARLEENGHLNVSDADAGNIYSLIYTDECINTICPRFSTPNAEQLKFYREAAIRVEDILLETEHNVYPLHSDRKKWYECQYIVLSFCEYLENIDAFKNKVNLPPSNNEVAPKHVLRCKLVVNAIDYILESINNAKY